MILGIDASNIRAGGGVTHIRELLAAASPHDYGFDRVIVWSGKNTLDCLPDASWLDKQHVAALDGNQIGRLLWQRFTLPRLAAESCTLLFIPGGNFNGNGVPYVALSQNLLPFDAVERQRFGLSWSRFRYFLLRYGQSSTFRNAAGVIFLTETAQEYVESEIGKVLSPVAIIPHGISKEFRREPAYPFAHKEYTPLAPFRWLYVSIVNLYKHQWNVVDAVANLREKGFHMTLDLVGPAQSFSLRRLEETIKNRDPDKQFVRYLGGIPHQQLPEICHNADGFVFASSCENMPIILLEAMSSGLPIACSDRGPMPEVLRDGGIYFNPEDVSSIMDAMKDLYVDQSKRFQFMKKASQYAECYTWPNCARATFSFLSTVAKKSMSHDLFDLKRGV
jgi:glycosyltransferase involved in cell wall biosynthesis